MRQSHLWALALIGGLTPALPIKAQETKTDTKPAEKPLGMDMDSMSGMAKKGGQQDQKNGQMPAMPGMQGNKPGRNGQMDSAKQSGHDMQGMDMSGKGDKGMGIQGMSGMNSMRPFAGVNMLQEGSGTSWQPRDTPMYAIMKDSGRWGLMEMYNVFVGYDIQGGPRGDYQANSLNYFMLQARRPIRNDALTLRAMLSLEPLTTTPRGYPVLLQSGEQYGGKPNVDRQHPHDFFMEVSAKYAHTLAKDSAAYVYVAPAGEPALGPVAFPHRLSAFDFPAAPIAHHWTDGSHITFGVLTLGAWKRDVQIEGSYFTGREPDEYRFDLAPFHPDSFSGRVSYNPGRNLSMQVSYGNIHSSEALNPQEEVRRTTASVAYNLPRRDGGVWGNSLIYGRNNNARINTDAYIVESTLNLANRNTFFTRLEFVTKLGEELNLAQSSQRFPLSQYTVGYIRDFTPNHSYQTGVGAAVTISGVPSSLRSTYGDSPASYWVFFRVRPAPMRHNSAGMGGIDMNNMNMKDTNMKNMKGMDMGGKQDAMPGVK